MGPRALASLAALVVLAGCAEEATPLADTTNPESPTLALEPVTESVEWTGRTSGMFCLDTVALAAPCTYQEAHKTTAFLGKGGEVLHVEGTVRWEDESGLQSTLVVGIDTADPANEPSSERGYSPLPFSWDLRPYQSLPVTLVVNSGDMVDDPSGDVDAGVSRAFIVTANVTRIPEPPKSTPAREEPFVFDGKTPFYVCPHGSPLGVVCGPPDGLSTNPPVLLIPLPPDVMRLRLNLTWNAVSDASRFLTVVLYHDGDPSGENVPYLAEGTSPLTLDWDVTAYAGQQFQLKVEASEMMGTTAAYVEVAPEQPFRIEGVLFVAP